MSHFYLCDSCEHYGEELLNLDVMPTCKGEPLYDGKRVMVDHGNERGHMDPYDDPLDVCPLYRRRPDVGAR